MPSQIVSPSCSCWLGNSGRESHTSWCCCGWETLGQTKQQGDEIIQLLSEWNIRNRIKIPKLNSTDHQMKQQWRKLKERWNRTQWCNLHKKTPGCKLCFAIIFQFLLKYFSFSTKYLNRNQFLWMQFKWGMSSAVCFIYLHHVICSKIILIEFCLAPNILGNTMC